MSGYTTATRGHDAEWLLQRERELNDHQLRAGRLRTPGTGDRSAETWLQHTPLTGEETAAAADNLRHRATAAGIDEHAVAEVLDMLGLTTTPASETATRTALGLPRKRRGTCHKCGRTSLHLRADGTLPEHSPHPGWPAAHDRCDGSRRQPSQAEKRTA